MINHCVTTAAPECDEEIPGPAGVLQFTDPYKDLKSWTFYCEYNITVRESSNILVKISSISMNSRVNACGDSYITLKDGFNQSSPMLGAGKYCSHNQVEPLLTTRNQLNIRTAIELGLGSYYMLQYRETSLECGGIFELSPETLHRAIESSTLSECTWIFIAPANYKLSMNFTLSTSSVETNCEKEYVEIRNGGTSVSPLISQACSNTAEKIITTDSLLYVKFHSANAQPSILLHANVTAIENTCSGILRVNNGTIISPNYPFTTSNKTCTWKIIAPSKKRIVFQFHDLHMADSLNCEHRNYLRITEKRPESKDNVVLGTFCGSAKPNIIKTSCNKAFIQFHSDYHNIGHFRGFILNFTTTDEPCAVNCGGILNADQGIISSPNFPQDYQPNQHCEWNLDLPENKIIKFQFFTLMIDNNPACIEDYLVIKETINGTDKNLGLYCNDSNPMPISTSSSIAKVIFHSNEKHEDSGFVITYTAIERSQSNDQNEDSALVLSDGEIERFTSCNSPCERVFRQSSGIIRPPHYPDDCALICSYKIIQPPGKVITLILSNLSSRSTIIPEVSVYDSTEDDRILGKPLLLQYSLDGTRVVNSTMNSLTLKFRSNWLRLDGERFTVTYSTLDGRCGGLFTEPSGTIQSPNYPGNYGNNEKCLWVIKAPPNRVISLTWLSFRTEFSDRVTMKEKYGIYLKTYRGMSLPPKTVTSTNILEIQFTSDGSVVYNGFAVRYYFTEA